MKKLLTFGRMSDNIHLAHGGIAQLGERLNGIQEVRGSIPLSSTIKKQKTPLGRFLFFNIGELGKRTPEIGV